MTSSTPRHAAISYNIELHFKEQLGRQGPCRVYREQYVAIPGQPSVAPDVVIMCDVTEREKNKRFQPSQLRPLLLVAEVLSASTERYDRGEKFLRYQHAPTLEIYILVSQTEEHVEVYRRSKDWAQEHFLQGQIIKFDPLDLDLVVSSLYEGVL